MAKTSIAIFQEYMVKCHDGELREFLENYSKNNTFCLEYQSLKKYDAPFASLLIDKPDEVLESFRLALRSSSSIPDDAEINFDIIHFDNIVDLKDISSKQIGQLIQFNAYIKSVDNPNPCIETAVYECRGCMRLQEIEQSSCNDLVTPSLCVECGGRSFRLLQEESRWVDKQTVVVNSWNTNQELPIVLTGDLCSYDDYSKNNKIKVLGILKTFKSTKSKRFEKYLEVINIKKLPDDNGFEEIVEDNETGRNTKEYNAWVDKVIKDSDGVCACCGGDKYLEAHHVLSYADYPDLRLDPNNGVALCKWCHGKYNSYYGHKGTAKNLIDFMNNFGNSKKEIIYINQTTPEKPTHFEVDKAIQDLFLERVKFLEDEYAGLCPINVLLNDSDILGLSVSEIDLLLKQNVQKGEIYMPVNGYVKVTTV